MGAGNLTVNQFENFSYAGFLLGSGSIRKTGTGVWQLAGGSPNEFTGQVLVDQGELYFAKNSGIDAFKGDLEIAGTGTAQIINSNQIPLSSQVEIKDSGTLALLSGTSETLGRLLVTGNNAVVVTNAITDQTAQLIVTDQFENSGTLNLQAGLLSLGGTTLQNSGIIAGGGLVANTLMNNAAGRVVPGAFRRFDFTSNQNQQNAGQMLMDNSIIFLAGTGELDNSGSIQGSGLLAMNGMLVNSGSINLQGDSSLFAPLPNGSGYSEINIAGGLGNNGTLSFSRGTSLVFGSVSTHGSGSLSVSSDAIAVFNDQYVNNGNSSVVNGIVLFNNGLTGSGGFAGGGQVIIGTDSEWAPGNSTSRVVVDPSISFASGSALSIELQGTEPDGSYDRIEILGTLGLAGNLDVTLLGDFTPEADDRFEIFTAAGGVAGTFDQVFLPTLGGGLTWDVLYEANAVALSVVGAILAGDYNGNGTVDAADYTVWADNFGSMSALAADGNGNGVVDAADYTIWADNFGTSNASAQGLALIPEPGTLALLALGVPLIARRRTAA